LGIESGSLIVMGFLVKVLLIPGPHERDGGAVQIILLGATDYQAQGYLDIDLRMDEINEDVALCMPLTSREEEDQTRGLMLKPTLQQNDQYERCGSFQVLEGSTVFLDAARNRRLAVDEYESLEKKYRKYTVTIVLCT
jgi:hypothetical protein